MARARVTVRIVDVDGSLRRFIKKFPELVRAEAAKEVSTTARSVLKRIETRIAVGPDAPHLRDDLSYEAKGLLGRIGILEDAAGKQAAPGSEATQGEVMLYNEFRPNRQPVLGNSVRAEANEFGARIAKALQRAVSSVSGGR